MVSHLMWASVQRISWVGSKPLASGWAFTLILCQVLLGQSSLVKAFSCLLLPLPLPPATWHSEQAWWGYLPSHERSALQLAHMPILLWLVFDDGNHSWHHFPGMSLFRSPGPMCLPPCPQLPHRQCKNPVHLEAPSDTWLILCFHIPDTVFLQPQFALLVSYAPAFW